MYSPFCEKFGRHHYIPGFIEENLFGGYRYNGACRKMKSKKLGQYRLSPNEEAQLIKEETDRRRKLRLVQVREQAKQNAAKIRQAVRQEKNRQIHKLAVELQNQMEKEKEEKVRHLEAQYENCLHSIGQGQQEAGQQVDQTEEREMVRQLENQRADSRGKAAMEKARRDKIYQEYEENKIIAARKSALEVEKERASKVAALPAPPPDPVLTLDVPKKLAVKMTDANAFSTTHYHLLDNYGVDKAGPTEQEDARIAAEEEAIRMKEQDQDLVRLHHDRLARARVRHNKALEAELLSHDYNNILMDLSDLQRADRERRQKVVANIPKQVYEPPYCRMEDKEDKQKNMEEAFEDMYMAETNFMGDLSLALDPHPPPETPSASESLEVSTLDEPSLPEPTLGSMPSVLKDMTNTPRKNDKMPAKKPEKVLRKLMDKIKTQRQDWMSKSVGDIRDVGQEVPPPLTNGHHEHVIDKAPTLSEYSLSDSEMSHSEPSRSVVQPVIHGMKQTRGQTPYTQAPNYSIHGHAPFVGGQRAPAPRGPVPSARGPVPQTYEPAALLHPMEVAAKIRRTDPYAQDSEEEVKPRKPLEERTVAEILEQQRSLDPIYKLMETGTKLIQQKRELEAKLEALDSYHKSILEPQSSKPAPNMPDFLMNGHEPPSSSSSVNLSSVGLVAHLAKDKPSSGFYGIGISDLPAHVTRDPASSCDPERQNVSTSRPKGFSGPAADFHPAKSHNGMRPDLHPPLPVGAYLSPAARQQQTNILNSSLPPAPFTVSGAILPGEGKAESHSDQMKKIREYQMNLLKRHEHSKKILSDTRAEIEQRRQELLERFPQLELKTSESDRSGSQGSDPSVSNIISVLSASGSHPVASRPEPVGGKSPPKSAVSDLLSKLASHPYYASRLSHENGKSLASSFLGRDTQPEKGGAIPGSEAIKETKMDRVRKSLSFNDSLQESPLTAMQQFHNNDLSGSNLDDTALSSSSTERGSPSLPGRRSGSDSDSDLLTVARGRNQEFEKRQADLRKQLDDIQKQKEEILQRHQTGQIQLMADQERLRSKLSRAQRQINQESDTSLNISGRDTSMTGGDTTGLETSDLSSDNSPPGKHPPPQEKLAQGQPPNRGVAQLAAHRPHELSTIHEVDTPASTRYSDRPSSGRPSLSSSEASSSTVKRSLDFSRPTIPEEGEHGPTPTDRRVAGESGYYNPQIDEVMARARELDSGVLDKLKQQTNDVFATLDTSEGRRHSPTPGGSFHTLSVGTLSESSLSMGPIDDSIASMHSQAASDNYAFRYVGQSGGKSESANGSFQSQKSWADELSGYKERFKPLQPDKSSGSNQDFKSLRPSSSDEKGNASDLSQHTLSDYDKSQEDSKSGYLDLPDPKSLKVDRSYDAMHFSVEPSHTYQKPFSSVSLDTFNEKPSSFSGEGSKTRSSIERLAEELSHQGPNSDHSGSTRSSAGSSEGHGDIPGVRGSPVGHHDPSDTQVSMDTTSRTRESVGSSVSEGLISSSSSYLDMELHGRNTRDFGPFRRDRDSLLLQLRDELREEKRKGPRILLDNESTKSGPFAYTSTPYTAQTRTDTVPGETSQNSISSDSSRGQDTSRSQVWGSLSSSSVIGRPSISSSESSQATEVPSSVSLGGPTGLSQYSLKSDTMGITLISKDQSLSQYSLDNTGKSTRNESSLTQVSLDTNDSDRSQRSAKSVREFSQFSPGDLSQYSLDKSSPAGLHTRSVHEPSQYSLDESPSGHRADSTQGLSQYSLDKSSPSTHGADSTQGLSQYSLDKTSPSQYSLDKTSPSGHGADSTQGLSQYSLDKTSPSGHGADSTQGLSQYSLDKTSPSGHGADSTQGLSQYSLDTESEPDSEDGYVEKKFANLDVLIQESRDIIAKHKQLINKNPNQSNNSSTTEHPTLSGQSHNRLTIHQDHASDVASTDDSYKLSTTTAGSSFDVTPLRYTDNSGTMVTSSLHSAGDATSLDQLGYESGISEEPNLTLISLSSNNSMVQDDFGQTPRKSGNGSHGTGSSNSTLSFEQHEASMTDPDISNTHSKSTQDTFHDIADFTTSKSYDSPSTARTLSPPRYAPPPPPIEEGDDTGSDSGSETLFHAVPVMVSPTMSLAMKFSSQQEPNKPPVSWSKLLDEEGDQQTTAVQEPPKPVILRSLDSGSTRTSSESQVARSLDSSSARTSTEQTLSSRPSADSSDSAKDTRLGNKVGERRKMFEVAEEPQKGKKKPAPKVPGTYLNKALQTKKDGGKKPVKEVPKAPVAAKGKPGAVVSLADFLTSHQGDLLSTLKKTPPAEPKRPGSAPSAGQRSKDNDESGVTRSVGPTGLSKTLSSWKKSRGVKSTAAPPQPVQSKETPSSSSKVVSKETPLTEEEKKRAADKIVYERHMRLANRLDDDEPPKSEDREQQRQAIATANRNKVKEFQKKLNENMKKKEQLRKQKKDGK
ncbi:serine-rich adhesin for platelets-like isoform X2 [Argopecten irradians]|uniref:serine-rich adhesin for platelets-like isoform X2 n=1 Tax=Argopecten irradians TaxID=31199 RepID=UPI00371A1ABC